jgi:1-acyl-sn-glycerol-3-phosphate acyltransferase
MEAWYRFFHNFCTCCYFHRISVVNPQNLPHSRPALYLGLHRNGAVDGLVYHSILSRPRFLISSQLRRSLLGKLFFSGIEVARSKDEGDRGGNPAALEHCRNLLESGRELFILPEGTSSLGPRHLPFRGGAARLLLKYLETGGSIDVIPLGITYECPWAFRSSVEVIVQNLAPEPSTGNRIAS